MPDIVTRLVDYDIAIIDDARAEIERLRADNDDLLEACEWLIQAIEDNRAPQQAALAKGRAAIRDAKGEAE